MSRLWTPGETAALQLLWHAGIPVDVIAQVIDRSASGLRQRRRELGLPTRTGQHGTGKLTHAMRARVKRLVSGATAPGEANPAPQRLAAIRAENDRRTAAARDRLLGVRP